MGVTIPYWTSLWGFFAVVITVILLVTDNYFRVTAIVVRKIIQIIIVHVVLKVKMLDVIDNW